MIERSKVFIAWAVVILGGFGFAYYANYQEKLVGSPIAAIGGQWAATDIVWHEVQGEWRLSTIMKPTHVTLENAQGPELLQSFCGSLLTKMPEAPDGVSRSQVFRIDLNAELKEGLIFPQAIPVQIKDGACQVKKVDEFYFMTFPGKLAGWELRRLNLDNSAEKGSRLELFFYKSDPSFTSPLEYKLACNAYFQDGAPLLPDVLAQHNLEELPPGTKVKVEDRKTIGIPMLNFSSSTFKHFKVVRNVCLEDVGESG